MSKGRRDWEGLLKNDPVVPFLCPKGRRDQEGLLKNDPVVPFLCPWKERSGGITLKLP